MIYITIKLCLNSHMSLWDICLYGTCGNIFMIMAHNVCETVILICIDIYLINLRSQVLLLQMLGDLFSGSLEPHRVDHRADQIL